MSAGSYSLLYNGAALIYQNISEECNTSPPIAENHRKYNNNYFTNAS